MKKVWKNILKYTLAGIFYLGAFVLLRETFIREMLAIFLITIGVAIQSNLFK